MTKTRMQAEKDEKQKKTATPVPQTASEPSQEDSVAQVAAVPARPTPESHPHLFDEFGNPR